MMASDPARKPSAPPLRPLHTPRAPSTMALPEQFNAEPSGVEVSSSPSTAKRKNSDASPCWISPSKGLLPDHDFAGRADRSRGCMSEAPQLDDKIPRSRLRLRGISRVSEFIVIRSSPRRGSAPATRDQVAPQALKSRHGRLSSVGSTPQSTNGAGGGFPPPKM